MNLEPPNSRIILQDFKYGTVQQAHLHAKGGLGRDGRAKHVTSCQMA